MSSPRLVRILSAVALAAAVLVPSSSASGTVTRYLSGGHALTAGATLTTATGSSYAFASVVADKPVRWNPCSAIHWRANVSRAPLGGLDVLKAAVANIAASTSTTWVFDGTTTTTPTSSYLPTTATQKPLLIGWTDGVASDLLRNKAASVLGMTRTAWFGRVTSTGTVAATRGAVVALDRTDKLALRGTNSWSAVALHELGHAVGLAHPNDSGELMNSILPSNLSGLQSGDKQGLYYLGRSQGCITL